MICSAQWLPSLTVTNDDAELEDVSDLGNDQVVPEHPDTPFLPLKATPNTDKNSGRDWRNLKETQRKTKNLENIIQMLSSPVKPSVIKTVVWKHFKMVDEILTYTKSSDIYESKMCQVLLNELSHLHKSSVKIQCFSWDATCVQAAIF